MKCGLWWLLVALVWLGCWIPSSHAFLVPSQRFSSSNPVNPRQQELRGCSVTVTDPETGCEVVLLGCFHGSHSSSQDVESSLTDDNNQVDVVVLELCASRFADLRRDFHNDQGSNNNDTKRKPWIRRYVDMVRKRSQKQGFSTAAAAAVLGLVSGMSTGISGLRPGLEFTTALKIAAEREKDIVLADQNVEEILHGIGRLPQLSLKMMHEWITSSWNWNDTFGKESAALKSALLGDAQFSAAGQQQQVSLWGFLTRSQAAMKDMLRLTVLPLTVLIALNLLTTQTAALWLESSWNVPAADLLRVSTVADTVAASDPISTVAMLVADVLFVLVGYIGIALPATRVILTERDDYLTVGIQEACRIAVEQNAGSDRAARVVAVLGLLHVNGVAKRLLMASKEATARIAEPEPVEV